MEMASTKPWTEMHNNKYTLVPTVILREVIGMFQVASLLPLASV